VSLANVAFDPEGAPVIQEPVQPTVTETPPARPRDRRNRVAIGIVIVACLALAVPVIGAFAAGTPRVATIAAGASNAAEPSDENGNNGNDKKVGKANGNNGNGNGNGNGNKGLKGNGGAGKGPITISAVSGNQVSLRTEDGWSRTITVTSTTVITKGGQTIGVGDLKTGDTVRFHQVRNADGSFSVDAITVPTPRTGGVVTAVGADSITVSKGGVTRVITVTGSTVYTVDDAAAAKSDVKVGSEIEAQGTVSGDAFTATAIDVELPSLSGQVTAKTADTITINKGDGTSATIHISGTTKYQVKGKNPAALSDIAVGDRVSAEGALRADGSIDATSVNGKGAKTPKQDDDKDDAAASTAPG
jgi:hypothetical protein